MSENTEIISKYVRANISSSKVVAVANEVRGKDTSTALNYLRFNTKKASDIIYGVVKSAIANAVNNHSMSEKDLYVKDIRVGQGPSQGGRRFAAKGRYRPIVRRSSNLTVVLAENPNKEIKKEKMETKSVKAKKGAANE